MNDANKIAPMLPIATATLPIAQALPVGGNLPTTIAPTQGTTSTNNVNNIPAESVKMDLATLMFTVQSERATLLEGMVRGQAAKIQYNNERLKELNQAMSLVNKYGETGGKLDDKITALNPQTGQMETTTVQTFLQSRGIAMPAGSMDKTNFNYKPGGEILFKYSKEDIALITSNIKNSIDSLTSTSQLDMTQLQATMNKYNQTFEALSSFISKYFQSLQTITSNLR